MLFVLFVVTHRADSSCVLTTSGTSPVLTQKFGSKTIIIKNQPNINLDEGFQGFAYCASGFRLNPNYGSASNYDSERFLGFTCISNQLFVQLLRARLRPDAYRDSGLFIFQKDNEEDYTYDYNPIPSEDRHPIDDIACTSSAYTVFESKHQLANCKNFESYALGAKLSPPIIIAGLCYDLEKLSIRYVSYKLQEPSFVLQKAKQLYPLGLNKTSLADALNSIEHILDIPSSSQIASLIGAAAETNFWLRIADFEIGNIVQTNAYYKAAFEENAIYFNIVWWKDLRTGNWRRFIELLEARSRNVTYDLYTGITGELRVPVATNKCDPETSKPLEFPGFRTRVPQFIWTHLNSTHEDVPENFVVIAYNSPYFDNFDQNSTLLCNDMCDDIEWLKPMQDSRQISAMGRFYCCYYEDVVGLLDGFPGQAANDVNANTLAI